jgi:hypothetical protein
MTWYSWFSAWNFHSLHFRQKVHLHGMSVPKASVDRKFDSWNMPPSMCRGGATQPGGNVDTAQIAVSSCSRPGRTSGFLSAVSCSAHAVMHTPMCQLPLLSLARGGLP